MRLKSTPAAALVVALTGGVLKVKGTPYTFAQGEQLRADHPLVRKYPSAFAPSGLTTQEYNALRHAYRIKARGIAA